MSNNKLLARLNDLRVANNLKPLKHAPKNIDAAIAKLAPARRTSPVAEYARSKGVNAKVCRAMLRRHFDKGDDGWELTKEVRDAIDEQAKRVKRAA